MSQRRGAGLGRKKEEEVALQQAERTKHCIVESTAVAQLE